MDYLFGALYISLGLFGGSLHYVKKRYIDNTAICSFRDYLFKDFVSTKKALWAIIGAEITLSLTHTSGIMTLSELVGAITVGYTADSGLNRAPKEE